ncbi:lysophospholipid acyltransferase family protein [Dokdonia sp. Hel_I_53]|uniref:lysophospholipid acyltransferase family protein n=1 Tax=Dokdonia sp. Hel_I_53 TaxID=1566287 RepID=UPI00119B6CBB|nr:lysophospholipid acyltransferase family protein [Dokdonia sp. Hel_I_53]TVZ51306.1 KDO2-lipid IV(A) lauroyltransferase [Dokdonia sp. Hel_I_53]
MKAIVFWLLYPILWLLSILPFRVLYIISDICYVLVYYFIGYRKKTVRFNLKTTFPNKTPQELKIIEKKFYSHLCDMFLEMIKSMNITKEELLTRYKFNNVEDILKYDKSDKSALLMLGHYASYEWIFALQLYVKSTGYAIYKKIKYKQLDDLIRNIRGRWNTLMIDSKLALKTIKENEVNGKVGIYGFVSDQSPRKQKAKFWTPFLGHELPFFTGVERMSREFNLPVFYYAVDKVKRGHYEGTLIELTSQGSETSEGEITGAYARELEKQIFEKPEFYLWTHQRYKLLGRKEEVLNDIKKRVSLK